MNLSDDEFTVLMIANQGEAMIPIGRWKAPVESLVERGFLRRLGSPQDPSGGFNNVITDAGRRACQARAQDDEDAFKEAVDRIRQQGGETAREAPMLEHRCDQCDEVTDKKWKFCPYCGVHQ